MTETLSVRLREGTREAHIAAERSPFIQAFLRGTLDRAAYVRFLADLLTVYRALEGALAGLRSHPALGFLADPALARVPGLERDLDHLAGPEWRATLATSAAATAYAAHLAGLAEREPVALAPHAYTRYLGDLSGGQVLARMAARNFGLEDGAGLAFYAFPGIADAAAYKQEFRRALDAVTDDPAVIARLVEEACAAFEWNARVADAALRPADAPAAV